MNKTGREAEKSAQHRECAIISRLSKECTRHRHWYIQFKKKKTNFATLIGCNTAGAVGYYVVTIIYTNSCLVIIGGMSQLRWMHYIVDE